MKRARDEMRRTRGVHELSAHQASPAPGLASRRPGRRAALAAILLTGLVIWGGARAGIGQAAEQAQNPAPEREPGGLVASQAQNQAPRQPGGIDPGSDPLESGFKTPPDSAKPRVWWHWMNGNVTKEGITADLEWMKRVGIGGMQMFDADIGNFYAGEMSIPKYVDKRIVFHTPEWKDMLRFAASEADRLGLELTMHISGGWSETGGPWVKPEQAMKKVVWSETRVDGPRKFVGQLAMPVVVNGPFQNVPRANPFASLLKQPPPPDPTYYADSVVIAYRVPEGEMRMTDLHPKVTASAPDFDTSALMDGDVAKTLPLPIPEGGQPAWIQFEFAQPFRARAVTVSAAPAVQFFGGGMPNGEIQASDDGKAFATLATLPGPAHVGAPERTYTFPETSARFYRVVLTAPPPSSGLSGLGPPPPKQHDIAEVEFHASGRVNRWEDKAGFGIMLEYDSVPTPAVPASAVVSRNDVVDLTSAMSKDGTLNWDVPAGKWVVLRMGSSLTGAKNAPAPPEATGFEVDKLNRRLVESYLDGFVGPVTDALGPLFGKSFQYFLVDSWEAGLQNWTDEMLSEFRTRRGYVPTPFLPVLTGRVVESAEISDRFLWDYRRTIADILAETHYATAAEYLHPKGIKIYGEAAGANSPMFQDALQNKGHVDIPMGEFWVLLPGATHRPEHLTDVREAASAAHIYGKPLVATESFTSFVPGWNDAPSTLKWIGDFFLAQGVNRFVIHTSVHQPFTDRKPGFTLGPFGQHYTRNNTWGEQSRGLISYFSRSSFMLQQGLFVADLAYLYGEGVPATVYTGENTEPDPAPPPGYAYDYINAEVLLTRTSVKDGRLVLPDGMSYRILVLPNHLDRMTPALARKIRDLVAAGATVVGPKPTQSPSLGDYPSADAEVRSIANEVWGATDGRTLLERAYGKGKVYYGKPLAGVLGALGVPPDVEYSRPKVDTTLVSIHRQMNDTHIYFVANQRDRREDVEVRFRIAGKAAELWRPETGRIEPGPYSIEDGRTTVPLHLGPAESVFVVFRQAATSKSRAIAQPVSKELTTVQGPWDVSFPPDWGAPASVRLETLSSWTQHPESGVKHFSGTATYTKKVQAPPEWFRPGTNLVLDLGVVKEIAEVSVNGTPVGLLWRPPFRADVSSALKPGANRLEIMVTNLWANRMIGDQALPEDKRFTWSTFNPYDPKLPIVKTFHLGLLESGLLGPVKVLALTTPAE